MRSFKVYTFTAIADTWYEDLKAVSWKDLRVRKIVDITCVSECIWLQKIRFKGFYVSCGFYNWYFISQPICTWCITYLLCNHIARLTFEIANIYIYICIQFYLSVIPLSQPLNYRTVLVHWSVILCKSLYLRENRARLQMKVPPPL